MSAARRGGACVHTPYSIVHEFVSRRMREARFILRLASRLEVWFEANKNRCATVRLRMRSLVMTLFDDKVLAVEFQANTWRLGHPRQVPVGDAVVSLQLPYVYASHLQLVRHFNLALAHGRRRLYS